MTTKGIILAGGSGTRLHPLTTVVSKQLLPVYNKPMIYYPLSVLMLSGINEILVISTPESIELFHQLLGDGLKWGITIEYAVQAAPEGIAQAFLIAERFINEEGCALILGDNIFYGHNLTEKVRMARIRDIGATVFLHRVKNPQDYGIATLDDYGVVSSIEEKPKFPRSNLAVTGLYFYDSSVVQRVKTLTPSDRGELEITDLNKSYMNSNKLFSEELGRGFVWMDTGSPDRLLNASNLIRNIEDNQSLLIGSPEEVAYNLGYISNDELTSLAKDYKSNYCYQLLDLINN